MEIHGGPGKRKRRKPEDPEWLMFLSDSEKEEERRKQWLDASLADTGLPVRIVNTLEDNGILTVGDLCTQPVSRLEAIANLGEVTIKKCRRLLDDLKLPNKLHQK